MRELHLVRDLDTYIDPITQVRESNLVHLISQFIILKDSRTKKYELLRYFFDAEKANFSAEAKIVIEKILALALDQAEKQSLRGKINAKKKKKVVTNHRDWIHPRFDSKSFKPCCSCGNQINFTEFSWRFFSNSTGWLQWCAKDECLPQNFKEEMMQNAEYATYKFTK